MTQENHFTQSADNLISLINTSKISKPFPMICSFINQTFSELLKILKNLQNKKDADSIKTVKNSINQFIGNINKICQNENTKNLEPQIKDYLTMSMFFFLSTSTDNFNFQKIISNIKENLDEKNKEFSKILDNVKLNSLIKKDFSFQSCKPFDKYDKKDSIIKKGYVFNPFKKGQEMHLLHVTKHPKCKEHYLAIGCDCRQAIPPIEYNNCYFCKLKPIQDIEEKTENGEEGDSKHTETLSPLDMTEQLHNLTPLTLQMIRYSDEKNKYPLQIIGEILFPSISNEKKLKYAETFVSMCFEKFRSKIHDKYIEGKFSIKDYVNQNSNAFNFSFSTAMDLVIPTVWKEFTIDFVQLDKTKTKNSEQHDNIETIFNPTLPNIFVQFLINLTYRKKAPVIYAFLRLHTRFNDLNSLNVIAQFLQKAFTLDFKYEDSLETLLKQVYNDDDSVEKAISSEDEKEYQTNIPYRFITDWNRTIDILKNSYLTEKAHAVLSPMEEFPDTSITEYFHLSDKSYSYETSLPFLVTNYLADGHNEFIHILEENSSIYPDSVYDTDPNLTNYIIDSNILYKELWNALAGKIDKNGNLSDLELAEKQFISSISLFKYTYVLNHYAMHYSKVIPQIPGTTITNLFSKAYKTSEISVTQKAKIYKYVIKTNNVVGLKILLENTMRKALETHPAPNKNLFEYFEENNKEHSYIELCAKDALNNAKNKSNDLFYICNILSLYKFITTEHPFFEYRTVLEKDNSSIISINFFYIIYQRFKSTFKLSKIPNLSINPKEVNTSTMLFTLVKLMNFAIENEHSNQSDPTKVFSLLEKAGKEIQFSDQERNDYNYIIQKAVVAPYLLAAFKVCFNSVFND